VSYHDVLKAAEEFEAATVTFRETVLSEDNPGDALYRAALAFGVIHGRPLDLDMTELLPVFQEVAQRGKLDLAGLGWKQNEKG